MRAPRKLLVSALAAAALTLSACGGGADDEAAEPAPTATEGSATPTESSSPSSSASSTEAAPGAGPEVARFLDRLKAGFDDQGSVHVAMTLSGPSEMTAEGDTTYGPDDSAMRMTMDVGGQEMTMVVIDEAVYLAMPGVTPAGKFFEVPEGNAMLEGFDTSGLSPAESFAAFDAGLLEVEERGAKTIDGQQTEHVELTVDTERAMQAQGAEVVPGLPETLTYDVWLGEQDRMRRIRYEVAGAAVVMDMTRWNEVGPIEAPTPEELVEAPEGF